MLRTLRVRDLAIIEELELVLEPGLNVVTGETGAGKSILLQALDVALGGRPDADLVRTGAEEAAVEALFVNVPAQVRERLVGAGIPAEDGEDELLVRRVIARGGRRRAPTPGPRGGGRRGCARRPRSWCAPRSCRARRRRSRPSVPAWCTPSAWPCWRRAPRRASTPARAR